MSTKYEFLEYRLDGQIGRLILNRPERLNALHQPAVMELERIAATIAEDDEVRVVAISGAGRAYCTGIDLKELSVGNITIGYHAAWERALRTFETMDKIVLCYIHRYAIGGGLQLALACDIRVCTRDAELGLPAIFEGLIPGLGTLRLAQYVGLGRAKRLTFLGDRIDADEAYRIGLVDHLVEADSGAEDFEAIIGRYLDAASEGCRLSKLALNQ